MRKMIIYCLLIFGLGACEQETHQQLDHNFTIQRLIVINDSNEMLMIRDQEVWAPPSLLYSSRQFIKEGIDSLANAYGIEINNIELRGQFSYKYDYQTYATIRNYYVARYVSGELKIPSPIKEVRWIPIQEAIDKNTVTSIKQGVQQIMQYPNSVWGASFMVSHVGDAHPTKMVEEFYPLFAK